MREIDDIISTDNGSHALILCTDGGVMYYSNPVENIIVKTTSFTESSHDYGDKPNSELESSDEVSHAETHSFTKSSLFLELSNIQRNQETDQSWHLKRVGANGAVALLRACRQDPNAMYQQSVITVRTLAGW